MEEYKLHVKPWKCVYLCDDYNIMHLLGSDSLCAHCVHPSSNWTLESIETCSLTSSGWVTWMDGWMKCYDCLRAPKITNSLNKSTMKNSRAKQPRHLVASWLARGLVIHSPPPPAPAGTDYYIQETSTSHQKPKLKQNRAEEEGELTNCQVELSVERSPCLRL